jgi:hypothetical protein
MSSTLIIFGAVALAAAAGAACRIIAHAPKTSLCQDGKSGQFPHFLTFLCI